MDNMEQTKWYVVYTTFWAEKSVMRQLNKMGIEARFETHRHDCRWGDDTREIDVPSVRGCLFVKVSTPCLPEVLSVRGVVGYAAKE